MLTIRLSRIGKKNLPLYRVIVSEKGRDPWGKCLEILGSYNPTTKALKVESEKVNAYIAKGAQMSPTINNLFIDKGVVKVDKVRASKSKKKEKK